jgi:hypothetical protein
MPGKFLNLNKLLPGRIRDFRIIRTAGWIAEFYARVSENVDIQYKMSLMAHVR